MKTIVYQSYRTSDVPAWISTCMRTVRAWAGSNGFDYRFYDDRLFDRVPSWLIEKAAHQVCPITDLARLVVARELLAEGYQRTIWVDADMLIFSPDGLSIDTKQDFAFCRELWLSPAPDGKARFSRLVNNSITVFTRNSIHLDFFIDACHRIAQHQPKIGKLDLGTRFLSRLGSILPLPLLGNVGMFPPVIMADIAHGTDQYLSRYAQHLGSSIACANLCGSLLGQDGFGIPNDNQLYEAVVATCLRTKGEVVNGLIAGPA